jgi:hypothetical protein
MILGALASGTTTVEGLLEGADVLATAQAMRSFGARVEQEGVGRWRIEGQGGFVEPSDVVDCGNAGTGVRLIMGAAAGFALCATFTGDNSLRGRPMSRVLDPLARMGATWLGRDKGRLPLTLKGGNLRGLSYKLPMASAQVKSAVLLAGLHAEGGVEVIEPEATRDHTERMLRAFGAEVIVEDWRQWRAPHPPAGRPEADRDPRGGAGRPVVGGLPAGGRPDRPRLGSDGRGRDAQRPAHRPVHDAAGDGRGPGDLERPRQQRRAGRRHHRPLFAQHEGRRRAARARPGDDRRISDPGGGRGLRRGGDRDARHRRDAGQGKRPHRPDGGRPGRPAASPSRKSPRASSCRHGNRPGIRAAGPWSRPTAITASP